MNDYPYDREHAVKYATRWAYLRNPLFYDFTEIGGNCTNFVSQCILAGTCTMNFTPTYGWYYVSPEDRAPAWTGVEYLYNFLTGNGGAGPYGEETELSGAEAGDVVQLARDGRFYHSLLIVGFDGETPLLAAQSNDVLMRPLTTYTYDTARAIRIQGCRRPDVPCSCFEELYNATRIYSCPTGQ